MAANDKVDQGQATATSGNAAGEGSKRDVAEFLQAPRKKRKSYVIIACSRNVSSDLQAGIEQFVKSNFKQVSVAQPKSPEELLKQFSRQILLLVLDDEFIDRHTLLERVGDMKRRKGEDAVPVLFLTRSPEKLVALYNEILLPFQEVDEYVVYNKMSPAQIYNRIRVGLANKNRRRSRRYRVDIALHYFNLNEDKFFPGRLLDLSMHGALLRSEDKRIFREGEQLKLHIPISDYLSPVEGDYLKVSARVRRVFISGDQVGISFEYLSEKQMLTLTRYLTEMVNMQSARKLSAMRARPVRS